VNHKLGKRRQKASRQHSTLDDHLQRQIGYLKRSCLLYDAGHEDEAQRIAVTLRVLLHDTGASKSLLGQLGAKSVLRFVDTGLYRTELDRAYKNWVKMNNPGHIIAGVTPGEAGLVVEGFLEDRSPAWVAPLQTDRLPPLHPAAPSTTGISKPFETWWTAPLVETSELKYFSRHDLVTIMANQDGGAHVDPEIDSEYEALTVDFLGTQIEIGNDLVDKTMGGDIPPMAGNVAAASIRQIAYEVLKTLQPHDDHGGLVRRLNRPTPIIIGLPANEQN
jgi:hypothetical protein